MPTPNAPHRRKKSPDRSTRIRVLASALLICAVICAAGAVAAPHLRDRTPIRDSASQLLFAAPKTAQLTDTSSPSRPKQLALTEATQTSLTISWRRSFDS